MKSRPLKAVKFQQDAQIFVWIVMNIVFVAIHDDEIVILTTGGSEITIPASVATLEKFVDDLATTSGAISFPLPSSLQPLRT
jgi:hypothetical protein